MKKYRVTHVDPHGDCGAKYLGPGEGGGLPTESVLNSAALGMQIQGIFNSKEREDERH